jgi:hypothetical protein
MANDNVHISFEAEIEIKTDNNGAHYFTYGALLFALPISANEIAGRNYLSNFTDFTYEPTSNLRYQFKSNTKTQYINGKIQTELINLSNNKVEVVELIPFGKTILRQTTF